MADGLVVYVPKLPCGLLPVYCASSEQHPAHDHGPTEGPRVGEDFWHCYGIYERGARPGDDVVEACARSTQIKEGEA